MHEENNKFLRFGGIAALLGVGLISALTLKHYTKLEPGKNQEATKAVKEQTLETVLTTNEQNREMLLYVRALEVIEITNRELSDFAANLRNYKGHNPQSQIKFTYLAQAKENILNIGQNIHELQQRVSRSGFAANKLTQSLYNAKVAQQRLMHEYISELRNIFTDEGIVNVQFNVEKYALNANTHAKTLDRELRSLSDYLNNQASNHK